MTGFTVVLSLAGTGAAPASARAESRRPNILFLLADDQRADAIAAHGNRYIGTPHLDRLAGRGFSFRRAYIMGAHHGAVCAPSRAMLLSGRSLYRVYDDLDPVTTLPELLRSEGYVTFATGKWHQSEAAFLKSFSLGSEVFFGGMSDHSRVPVRDVVGGGRLGAVREKGFSSTLFADAAIAFLEEQASRDTAPFLAYVSFTAPHDPRTPPPELLAEYPAEGMPLPANFMPLHPFDNGWMSGRDEQLAAWPRTPEVIRAQLAEYYALISHMDAQIGRILDALHRSGHAENTLIFYASDNGLALGSHGLLGKQSLYEHSTRVPLIAAGPGIPHGQSEALVYLYDVFPTLCELAGVELPDGVEGRSLTGIWEGRLAGVRHSLFTAYEDRQRAVRDGRWKLIRYPRLHHTQLFDLLEDPWELRNLADIASQQGRVARMMRLLESWQRETGDPHPLTAAEREPMSFDYGELERQPDRHQPEVIRRKYFDGR